MATKYQSAAGTIVGFEIELELIPLATIVLSSNLLFSYSKNPDTTAGKSIFDLLEDEKFPLHGLSLPSSSNKTLFKQSKTAIEQDTS